MASMSDYERGMNDFNVMQTNEKETALDGLVLGDFDPGDWTSDPSKEWKRGFTAAADKWQQETY